LNPINNKCEQSCLRGSNICKIPPSDANTGMEACLTDDYKNEFPGSLYSHDCTLLTDQTNCDVFTTISKCEICMDNYSLDATDQVCEQYCERDSYMCKTNNESKIENR